MSPGPGKLAFNRDRASSQPGTQSRAVGRRYHLLSAERTYAARMEDSGPWRLWRASLAVVAALVDVEAGPRGLRTGCWLGSGFGTRVTTRRRRSGWRYWMAVGHELPLLIRSQQMGKRREERGRVGARTGKETLETFLIGNSKCNLTAVNTMTGARIRHDLGLCNLHADIISSNFICRLGMLVFAPGQGR